LKTKPTTKDYLAQLEPEGIAANGQGWQQRKSAQTRVAIMEAAIDCLERHGYASTTTQLIAETAEISRGAMLHHYATKQELIAAVIEYAFYKRLEGFVGRIEALSEQERVNDHAGIELYWQSLLTREFAATLQLSVAARTDEELREILLPRHRRYDRIEREMVLRVFPEWQDKPEAFELAMDYCIAAMEGLVLNHDVWDDRRRRIALRALISGTILMLRNGELTPPAPETYLKGI
jgi:AcrR family transcriptional regulator